MGPAASVGSSGWPRDGFQGAPAREISRVRGFNQLHVLVVDDDLVQAEALAELLAYDMGVSSSAVQDGEAAIKNVAMIRPDLAILDCLMPGLSGVETLCMLRERVPDIRAILYTGLPLADERVAEFLSMPNTAYVVKGNQLDAMYARISELADPARQLGMEETFRPQARGTKRFPRVVMPREERREQPRTPCDSMAAHLAFGDQVVLTTIGDVSSRGASLVGEGLPTAGTLISLLVGKPSELIMDGYVAWSDARRTRIGVELAPSSASGDCNLADVIAMLETEANNREGVALLFVDDPMTAAQLCIAVRRRGYLPRVVRTPLEAVTALEELQSRVRVAVVARRAVGLLGEDVRAFLADEYPTVLRVDVDDAGASLTAQLDHKLDRRQYAMGQTNELAY